MAPPFLQICSQLLNAIREALRRLLSSISHCANSLYCPLLPFIKNDPKPRHLAAEEQEAAWRLLKQLESPGQTESTNVQHLRSLTTLASSQDPSVQLPAAMCLLAFSQADPIQALPKELIPALHSLLQSLEQEVQIYACCTLSNLLQRNLVSVDEILTEDTTKALLESLESSDSALQNAACCCLVQLLPLPGCSKVMVDSGAVIPLLVLAKGYEPRVQLAAVTALRTLATSSWGRTALQEDGAFPILVLLLQSSDPELQYSSSGALAALSVDHACRISLLNLGDRLLLKSLIQLTSSPVEKVCCQACSCLQVLATEDHVQKHLISPVTLQELHSLFSSSSCTIQHAALSLLHSLSCNPTSKETLLAHGLVQTLCEVILENQLTAFSTGLAANMLEHLTEPSSLRLILRAQGPEALLQAVDKLQTFSDCESSMALVLCALASLLKFDAVQRYVPPTFVSHSVQLLLCIRAAYSCPHVRLHARNALLYLTQECRAESLGSFLPGVVDTLEVLLTEHKLHSQELALLILTSLTPDPFVQHSINQGSLSHPVRELSAELEKVRDLVASLLTRCQSPSPTPSPGAGLDPSPGAGLDPSPGAGLDPSPGAGLDPS